MVDSVVLKSSLDHVTRTVESVEKEVHRFGRAPTAELGAEPAGFAEEAARGVVSSVCGGGRADKREKKHACPSPGSMPPVPEDSPLSIDFEKADNQGENVGNNMRRTRFYQGNEPLNFWFQANEKDNLEALGLG